MFQIADGYSDPAQLREALKGVDVLVSALNRTDSKPLDALAEAAVDSGVVVYFPAEYGTYVTMLPLIRCIVLNSLYVYSDHRYDGLPMHKEWAKKEKHFKHAVEYAKSRQRDMKVVAVYAGPFTEDSIDVRSPLFPEILKLSYSKTLFTAKMLVNSYPFHSLFLIFLLFSLDGIDLDARTISTYGSSSTRITFTTKADLARSIAQLAILSMSSSAGLADSVPSHVRIAGYSPSMRELAGVLQRLDGGNEFKILQADKEPVKKELVETHAEESMEALPAFMRYDHSSHIQPFFFCSCFLFFFFPPPFRI